MQPTEATEPVQAAAQRGSWELARPAEFPRDARALRDAVILVVMVVATIGIVAEGLLRT